MKTDLERQLARLGPGDHACLIFETDAERLAVVVPFLQQGLARGDRCLHVGDEGAEVVRQALVALGVDVEECVARGALRFLPWREATLHAVGFDSSAMLDMVRQTEKDALRDGYSGISMTIEMAWAVGLEGGMARLRDHEALLTRALAGRRTTLICEYDRRHFPAPCIHDVLRTHPFAILGEDVCHNAHCEPPDLILQHVDTTAPELASGRVDWKIAQLKRANETEKERLGLLARLQTLSRRLLEVQEGERRHLARELHDEIGQALTGLRLQLKPPQDLVPEVVAARLEQARSIVDDLLHRVRGLSFDLRPAALDQLGLLPALLALFERLHDQSGLLVSFKHHGLDARQSPNIETAAYRIVQEALTNVVRHACVAGANVRVWVADGSLGLQVEDRGRGFDVDHALADPSKSGLAGMRERAALIGGQLSIESRSGGGTHVSGELPLDVRRSAS